MVKRAGPGPARWSANQWEAFIRDSVEDWTKTAHCAPWSVLQFVKPFTQDLAPSPRDMEGDWDSDWGEWVNFEAGDTYVMNLPPRRRGHWSLGGHMAAGLLRLKCFHKKTEKIKRKTSFPFAEIWALGERLNYSLQDLCCRRPKSLSLMLLLLVLSCEIRPGRRDTPTAMPHTPPRRFRAQANICHN